MAIRDILAAFENETSLPVDLKRVADWIKSKGIQDDIAFVGVDIDVGVIRGYLHRYTYHSTPYGDPVRAANIYFGKDQGPEWINMVCCKELIHLMDGKNAIGGKAQFDQLVKRLVLPRELDILLEDPDHVRIDRVGDMVAAALLLPMAARTALLEPYAAGKVTAQDIADLAMMPLRYVLMVMSDRWVPTYEVIKKL